MSNGHEENVIVEVKLLGKELEYLTDSFEKWVALLTNHTEKDGLLNQEVNNLKYSNHRQEKVLEEIKKILIDTPEDKRTGLVTEVRDLQKAFSSYVSMVSIEKQEAKKRAIEREKERLVEEEKKEKKRIIEEEKKEKEKLIIIEKKEKAFNRKMQILGAFLVVIGILIPTIVSLLIYKWSTTK